MIKTAIIYNHRGRLGVDGTGPVEVRVTVDRKSYYICTGVRVKPKCFKFGRVVNCFGDKDMNEKLEIILSRVDAIVNETLEEDRQIDVAEIRRRVWASDGRRKVKDGEDMLAWMLDEVEKLDVAAGTKRHYRGSVAALKESGVMKRWPDVSVENVHRFDAFLHTIKRKQTDAEVKLEKPAENIRQATVRNYHKDIRAMLGRALKFGLIKQNPYDRMRGEIKLFVFQMYTGMAYSDMQAFSLDKCQCVDGKWVLTDCRVKTNVAYFVQLLPQALKVVQKYGGALPQIYNQIYNKNLKQIAKDAGIKKRVTSHVARHTFATWALHNGVPIETVARILGHANIRITQRYAKVIAQDVYKQFDKLSKL